MQLRRSGGLTVKHRMMTRSREARSNRFCHAALTGAATPGHGLTSPAMLHLIKLSVGIRDIEHLRAVQAERLVADPPLLHRTRQWPKRAAEILEGGSIYWVIAGHLQCRQAILDIRPDQRPDGSPCAAVVLDSSLVPVEPRPTKPFQGWRYLKADVAPADLIDGSDTAQEMPSRLRLALRELCLL